MSRFIIIKKKESSIILHKNISYDSWAVFYMRVEIIFLRSQLVIVEKVSLITLSKNNLLLLIGNSSSLGGLSQHIRIVYESYKSQTPHWIVDLPRSLFNNFSLFVMTCSLISK